jgi:hypothetical protein
MIKDKNKGMRVNYNVLNLPKMVAISNSRAAGSINYSYSADGVKRKVTYNSFVELTYKPDILTEAIIIVLAYLKLKHKK